MLARTVLRTTAPVVRHTVSRKNFYHNKRLNILTRFAKPIFANSPKITHHRVYKDHRRYFSSSESGNSYKASVLPQIGKGVVILIVVVGSGYVVYNYMSSDSVGTVPEGTQRPKIVILGSGWAALSLVQQIDTNYYDVTVVSPRNYFLFTPLLPSVTVGTVDPRSITEPVRNFFNRTASLGVTYYEAACTDIDPKNFLVKCKSTHSNITGGDADFIIPYDHLVMAVGAVNNTFGTPGVYEHCNFLKEIDDAVKIRKKIMDCFESANLPGISEEEKKRLLNFVVVGGGPNGVEFAAELRDFVYEDVKKNFPQLLPYVNITLLELLDHILSTYDAKISDYTENHFKKTHIDVKTKSQVLSVNDKVVVTKRVDTNQLVEIPYGLCVWSTGIGPSPLVEVIRSKFPQHQTNRRAILTDGKLMVKGTTNIWSLGDCSTIDQQRLINTVMELFEEADTSRSGYLTIDQFNNLFERIRSKYPQIEEYGKRFQELFEEADVNEDKKLSFQEFRAILNKVDTKLRVLPATAQVASQQGTYLGRNFNRLARGEELKPFRYRHFGSYAYIGDFAAVAEFPNRWVWSGFGAWWLWRSIYLSKQVSLRNKVLVAFDWSKTAVFGRDITRN